VFEAHLDWSSLENLKERDCKRLFPRLRIVLVFSGYVVSVKSSLSSWERGNGYTRARCLCDLKME